MAWKLTELWSEMLLIASVNDKVAATVIFKRNVTLEWGWDGCVVPGSQVETMKQGLLAYCFIPIFESNAFFFQFILVLLGSHNIWSPKVFCSNMEAFGAGNNRSWIDWKFSLNAPLGGWCKGSLCIASIFCKNQICLELFESNRLY